jgi:phosphorylcholine metabolism protein LicD
MFFEKSRNEINEEELIPREDFEKLKDVAKVHQDYLNNLFVFYKLKPNPLLEALHNLSYELLKFFDNFCAKHELQYWIDYGTLLGAIRHGDFIPWDDDLDVGMMREDYIKLKESLKSEIDSNNLKNIICSFDNNRFQIRYFCPEIKEDVVAVNVFPYDYIDGNACESFEEKYIELQDRCLKEDNSDELLEEIYSQLNLTLKKDEYCVPGVEGICGKDRKFSLKIFETKILFPLEKIQFGKYDFPAPNDSNLYARGIYGNKLMKIPKKIQKYDRLTNYKKMENIEEIFRKASEDIKKINDSYDF